MQCDIIICIQDLDDKSRQFGYNLKPGKTDTKCVYDFLDKLCEELDLNWQMYCLVKCQNVIPGKATFAMVTDTETPFVCSAVPVIQPLPWQESMFHHNIIPLILMKDANLIMTFFARAYSHIFINDNIEPISNEILQTVIELDTQIGSEKYVEMSCKDRMTLITEKLSTSTLPLLNEIDATIWEQIVNMDNT